MELPASVTKVSTRSRAISGDARRPPHPAQRRALRILRRYVQCRTESYTGPTVLMPRDPRDVLVSQYYSLAYGNPADVQVGRQTKDRPKLVLPFVRGTTGVTPRLGARAAEPAS